MKDGGVKNDRKAESSIFLSQLYFSATARWFLRSLSMYCFLYKKVPFDEGAF